MHELHGLGVLEEIAPGRIDDQQVAGHDRPVHQRPGVVAHAAVEPGDQAAEIDLDQHQHQQPVRRSAACARSAGAALCGASPRATTNVAVKIRQASNRCVASRYWLTSVRSTRPEATIHQPTAPCSPPSSSSPTSFGFSALLEPAGRPEEQQRQREHDADPARQDAVRPLPPEDRLELAEAHAGIELPVFRDLLVLRKLLLPVGIGERRDDAVDRLPFGDRQTGIGEPRRAADQEQREHHQQHEHRASRAPAHGCGRRGRARHKAFRIRRWRSCRCRERTRSGFQDHTSRTRRRGARSAGDYTDAASGIVAGRVPVSELDPRVASATGKPGRRRRLRSLRSRSLSALPCSQAPRT